jgi:hypothetical protein
MKIVLCIIGLVTAATPVFAQSISKGQCDSVIWQAFRMEDRYQSHRILNSETVRTCFRLYPELDYKYFPLTSDESGMICDRGQTRSGKCQTQREPDPNFPVRLK